jgi:excisionase family DNA binding protein
MRGTGLMTEPWVSVEDAAKHVGVVKETIYRWIDTKRLPAQKIGKLWKLKLSEVDAWVRAGGAGPESGEGGGS